MHSGVMATLALSLSGPVLAQTQPGPLVVMSGGYSYPQPVNLAPGQVLTWFVSGLPARPGFARAVANPDLPTTLERKRRDDSVPACAHTARGEISGVEASRSRGEAVWNMHQAYYWLFHNDGRGNRPGTIRDVEHLRCV